MSERVKLTHVESILLLTAFAASAVDVIGFASLGRVLASAMTGNLALLAYHIARGETQSATGSVIALSGFVVGCLIGFAQRRGRTQQSALNVLLASETALLVVFAAYALWAPHLPGGPSDHLQIGLLAVAMGMQAVIGQIISLTTIVFTMTLTRLVGNSVDALLGNRAGLHDVQIQGAVVLVYLSGAILSAILVIRQISLVVLLPLLGVSLALATQRRQASSG